MDIRIDEQKVTIAALQAENERLRETLNEFFKVVIVNGKTYRPGIELCSGCPHITISRGWECFYKRDTTECAYPEKMK